MAGVSGFALAMAGTPGPNNMMLTASGANYGFRRSLPHICGVALGVAVIILVVGAAGSPLMRDPRIHDVLKWAGILYLLWLAWKIAVARPTVANATEGEKDGGKPFTALQGGLFQLINPKLWAMVAGAVAAYGGVGESPVAIAAVFGVIFGSATLVSAALWTMVGVGAGRFIRTEPAMRWFNGSMAALLAASLIPVLFE